MSKEKPRRVSLLGGTIVGALALVAASATVAFAGGPGRGGGDDDDHFEDDHFEDVADVGSEASVDDHSGPGSGSDDEDRGGDDGDPGGAGGDEDSASGGGDGDNSGPGSGDEDGGSESGGDGDNSGAEGDDEGNSGAGSGDGGNSGSGSDDDDDDDDSSGSGSGSDDDGGSSGHGGGDDGGSSGHGGDDGHSGSGGGSGSSGANPGSNEIDLPSGNQAMLVEVDEHGNERVAGEALLTGNRSEIAVAIQAGYVPISQQSLPSMDCYIVRLALPVGVNVDQAVAQLQELAPNAIVAANTIYHSSEASVSATPARRRARAVRPVGVMGLIDTGVDAAALGEGVVVAQRSFAATAPTAREHGSAVAALAASHGMRMHVADVFASSATGDQIASAESIASALDWMMSNNVAVINVSIEGPNNSVLQALVRRASERGFVIVAAAGNGGPNARPAFPAAFDGSLAVTAIDGRDRPYIRANRGGYIDFAARGVDINIASGNENFVVSGTSFSSPLVAAHIASRLDAPSPERARLVVEEMRQTAIDLGAPGHDPIFGWGAVRD